MPTIELLLQRFCQQHQLPKHYITMATTWFVPLAEQLAHQHDHSSSSNLLVGINGCQGSGKSTLAALLATLLTEHYQKRVVSLSIDDFYLTQQQRQTLARTTHPLFVTRGVPGTHDTALLKQCLEALQDNNYPIYIPRFNKAIDDRYPPEAWDSITQPVDIILLEGWCVGSPAQSTEALLKPVNHLEQQHDSNRQWRTTSNTLLATDYQAVFAMIDTLLMLKAPDFSCVYDWRKQQEAQLRQQTTTSSQLSNIMDDTQLRYFIEHYQRITEHTLKELPKMADSVFELNHQHTINSRLDKP